MKRLILSLSVVCLIAIVVYAYWKYLVPTHRVAIRSELIMLGDLDNDHRWTDLDLKKYSAASASTNHRRKPWISL